jgi:hypothetical protein
MRLEDYYCAETAVWQHILQLTGQLLGRYIEPIYHLESIGSSVPGWYKVRRGKSAL